MATVSKSTHTEISIDFPNIKKTKIDLSLWEKIKVLQISDLKMQISFVI